MTQRLLPALVLAAAAGATFAKLPPPDDAAKAKAAEATAKTAWQAKVDTYQLCKVQDRLAGRYGDKSQSSKGAVAASATATKLPAPVAAASSPAAAASAPAAASNDKPTPVATAGSPPPPCQDPGPFTYNQPQQTPLESSGAHSPAGTAVNPPSVRPESGTMTQGKK